MAHYNKQQSKDNLLHGLSKLINLIKLNLQQKIIIYRERVGVTLQLFNNNNYYYYIFPVKNTYTKI
jgi:hypothetical protein